MNVFLGQSAFAVAAVMVSCAFGLAVPMAGAQTYPERPITLMIPVPAGGTMDTQARALAASVSKQLSQPVVLVSRPGAGATMPAIVMAQSTQPDGYTLGVVSTNIYRLPHLQTVGFDPMKDFTYIANVTAQPFGITVRQDSPWKTLNDVLVYARAHPGEVSYGASAAGSTMQINMERIAKAAGVKFNFIPFKGIAETYTAVSGGHIDLAVDTGFNTTIESGRGRLIAMLSDQRAKKYPAVPTVKELGFDAIASGGWGIAGPRHMDPKIVGILSEAFRKAMSDPVFLQSIELQDQTVTYMDPKTYTEWATSRFNEEKRALAEIGLKLQ